MKDNPMLENTAQVAANPAEAEERQEAASGLAKFKDVQALVDAYTALEAEFTRRSQRLKELEANAANKGQSAPAVAENAEAPSQTRPADTLSDEVKNAVIKEYLTGVYTNRGVPIIAGGGAVTAVRRTPSTLREAGALAKNFFDNKEDK